MPEVYLNLNQCQACQNRCCERYPGAAYPEDVAPVLREGDLLAAVEAAIRTGKWCLDSWEGDPLEGGTLGECYFLRPAIKGHQGEVFHPSWGGDECCFLSSTGCELLPALRPRECRLLEPKIGGLGKCRAHYKPKRGSALAWRPYQEILRTVRETLEDKS